MKGMTGRDPETGHLVNLYPMLSRPVADPALVVLSLGAGVQSTTLALMAAHGDVGPMPDCAIFADTGWEPRRVYEHLDWLETRLPFPIVRVRRDGPDLGDYHMATAHLPLAGRSTVPLYTSDPQGMLAKQCSREFKTRVVTRHVRSMLGLAPKQRAPAGLMVEMWLGMSTDEISRVAPHEAAYIQNRHPLVEIDTSRQGCLRWLEQRQYPRPPKSSCVFCPFRDNAAWIRMGNEEPADFARAVVFDEAARSGYDGMTGAAYVHRNRIPLRDLDLTAAPGEEQDLFAFDCEGGCGL